MSDQNRGAYTPQSEAPLAFDARRGGPSGRPLPVTLIVSAAILGVLVIAAFVLYQNGARKPGEPPQPVGEPVAEAPKAPEPIEAKPTEAPPGLQVYSDGVPVSGPPAAGAAPTFAPPPEQPAPRPAETVPLRPAQPAPAPVVAAAPPPKAAPPPAAKETAPAPAPVAKATPAPKEPAPAPLAKATPAPKEAAAPAAKVPPPTSSSVVQIGAFSTRSLADAGWNKLAGLSPGDMVGRTKIVEKAEVNGNTVYRAQVGGFASRAEAVNFCMTLTAKGANCTVKN